MGQTNDIGAMISRSFTVLVEQMSHGQSQRMLDYLAFSAKFHTYSPENQMLIFLQCPHATRVAGYRNWQAQGYQVARGQIGIRIKAPIVKKDEEKGNRVVGFYEVSVFDVSQLTEDKRPPTFFPEIYGDFEPLYSTIVNAIEAESIHVTSQEGLEGVRGYRTEDTIFLEEGLSSGDASLTLLHSWADLVMHQRTKVTRSLRECHAEATCYIVASHFGIPTPYSSDYLLHWGNTPDDLKSEMDIVLRSASHLISRIETVLYNQTGEQPNGSEHGDAQLSEQ